MGIEILTGVPGAGKTYFAVHRINKEIQDQKKNFLIFHNIEGLKVPDYRVISLDWQTEVFHAERMSEKLRSFRSEYGLEPEDIIHIYVDEAQRFFPPELKNTDVLYFFDYHRHFGVNITLITQHEKKLTYKITTLAEIEIRAVNARINPFSSSFIYKLSSGGEQYATQRLPKEKEVFALYKSFQAGTGKMKKSNLRYIVLALVICAPLAWLLFFKVFARSFGLGDEPPTQNATPRLPISTTIEPRPFLLSNPDPITPPAVPATNEDTTSTTNYYGPEIKEYSYTRDAVLIDSRAWDETDLETWMSVREFLQEYPPTLYGYGYFHCPNRRFVILSASNQETIFPVKNSVYVRQYIKSEDPPQTEKKPPEYPLDYLNLPKERPDGLGYTKEDYERVFMRQRGFPYPEPGAATTQPGEYMQPGAPAGAAQPPSLTGGEQITGKKL